jgi:nitrite reductase/ring-hydroxylating ferredoxin subunit
MHTLRASRRSLLVFAAACAACGSQGSSDAGKECVAATTGRASRYCLLTDERVQVRGGAVLRVGEALVFNVDDNTAIILARDEQGHFARSAICPHACCVVALCSDTACGGLTPSPPSCGASAIVHPDPSAGVVCPCHGSQFRLSDGAVLTGPARAPLRAYAVELDGTDAWVDTGTEVDPAKRLG